MSFLEKIRNMFKSTKEVCERVERIDRENREVRHDLRNTQAKVDALKMLVIRASGREIEDGLDDKLR